MAKKISFVEGVVISWRKEWQIGDPLRIARLAFFTVWYGLAYMWIFVRRALTGKTDWRK